MFDIRKTEKIVWPYVIAYGNKYVKKEEEANREVPCDDVLRSNVQDFLASLQGDYVDENGNLPEDWYESIFWDIKELNTR